MDNQLKRRLSLVQMANLSNRQNNNKIQLSNNKILEVSGKNQVNLRKMTSHQRKETTN